MEGRTVTLPAEGEAKPRPYPQRAGPDHVQGVADVLSGGRARGEVVATGNMRVGRGFRACRAGLENGPRFLFECSCDRWLSMTCASC